MTTVAIAINKKNLSNLTPFIGYGLSNIESVNEMPKFWQVTARTNDVRNEFIFDKRDFVSYKDILSTILSIATSRR